MSITLTFGEETKKGNFIDATKTVFKEEDESTITGEYDETTKKFTVDGNAWDVNETIGGRKRRSSKKYKKGGSHQKMTIGGRKSKKCKKGGKRPKKTRRH